MRKTILFGAIFSAFLVLSIAWVVPVQVKAYELNTAEEIKNKIDEMGQNLANDEDIQQLIDLNSNQEIENIFKQVAKAETSDEIRKLADEYVEIIGKEQLNQVLENIGQEYLEDYNSIITSLKNLFSGENNNEIGTYRIEQVNDKLKIKKLDTIKFKENSLVLTGEGNIIFPNGETVTQDIWANLAEFCLQLSNIGLFVEYVGLIIEYIGVILTLFGFVELGGLLVEIGFAIVIVGFIWAMFFLILSMFFEALSQDGKSKTVNKKLFLIEKIRIKILNFIRQFFQRIAC